MWKKIPLLGILTFLFLFFGMSVSAHTTLTGSMVFDVEGNEVKTVITLPEERSLDDPELFDQYLSDSLTLTAGSSTCAHVVQDFDTAATTTITLSYACEEQVDKLKIDSEFLVFEGYEFLVFLSGGDGGNLGVLNESNTSIELSIEQIGENSQEVSSGETFFGTLSVFTWQGMKHIYIGLDHILFVLVLILISKTLRQMLILVTAFTVAHSITLILAKLGVIIVPPSIIEPIIALSIAYVAFEKEIERGLSFLMKKRVAISTTHLWQAVFAFGLFHGLGFASVFSELNIPDEFFLTSLISFNLGVEIGQLTIVLAALPVLWLFRNKIPDFAHKQWVERIALWLIGLVALWWFVERIWG